MRFFASVGLLILLRGPSLGQPAATPLTFDLADLHPSTRAINQGTQAPSSAPAAATNSPTPPCWS